MKKKVFLFTALLIIGGSAGIYTAFAAGQDQMKENNVQKAEIKKEKKAEDKQNTERTAAKLGVSTEGKTEDQIKKDLNTARFEKRHELLIEHAKELGIETEGKKDEEIILEIGKIKQGK
ncbi:hypothetical protein D0U04_01670 [Bacillus clarus]|uniref:Group-specific protein n=1 Tax=Bacillus clarus TaxID=2338372 RepID=A0A090YVU5_9BACI|nr:hypothetical protein [Bacillus clarus]KFN02397.1 hypothetical protein DJ93_1113 [Bacillus clarus]RFT68916.1 hypothetical protein D0U04_01670 [Bacillus clarus]